MSSNTAAPMQGTTQLNQVNEVSQTTSNWMDSIWSITSAIASPFIAVGDAVFNTSWVVPTEDWTDQQEESVVTHDDVQAALDQLGDEERAQLKEILSQFRSSPEESAQWLLNSTDLGGTLFHDFSDKAQAARFLIENRDQLKFGEPEYSLEELDMSELDAEEIKYSDLQEGIDRLKRRILNNKTGANECKYFDQTELKSLLVHLRKTSNSKREAAEWVVENTDFGTRMFGKGMKKSKLIQHVEALISRLDELRFNCDSSINKRSLETNKKHSEKKIHFSPDCVIINEPELGIQDKREKRESCLRSQCYLNGDRKFSEDDIVIKMYEYDLKLSQQGKLPTPKEPVDALRRQVIELKTPYGEEALKTALEEFDRDHPVEDINKTQEVNGLYNFLSRLGSSLGSISNMLGGVEQPAESEQVEKYELVELEMTELDTEPKYNLEELDMTELEESVKTPSLIYRTLVGKVARRVYFEEFNGPRDLGNQGIAMSYLETVNPARSFGETFIALLEEVEKKASEEGVYRVGPGAKEKADLQSQLTNVNSRDQVISAAGVHVLTGTIKQQLREIPNEKKVLSSQILVALGKDVKNVDKVKGEIAKLPPEKKAFLKLLVDHVAKVAESESKNSMSVNNLAIVIAPNLYRMGDDLSQELSIAGAKNDFFVFLVNNREAIFQA